ncbi:MAG: hypothetical protein K5695_10660 [Oscillospiraceae bacterium]|nr:hypothetical protein [Oscillospiraceae bacterium]
MGIKNGAKKMTSGSIKEIAGKAVSSYGNRLQKAGKKERMEGWKEVKGSPNKKR